MIHIGAIRKIFRGWRILICAWVDDNSPLKSQFFMLFRGDNGKEYIRIGKGYDPKTDTYPRMVVTRWSIIRYVGERHWEKSFVWFGLGKFMVRAKVFSGARNRSSMRPSNASTRVSSSLLQAAKRHSW